MLPDAEQSGVTQIMLPASSHSMHSIYTILASDLPWLNDATGHAQVLSVVRNSADVLVTELHMHHVRDDVLDKNIGIMSAAFVQLTQRMLHSCSFACKPMVPCQRKVYHDNNSTFPYEGKTKGL